MDPDSVINLAEWREKKEAESWPGDIAPVEWPVRICDPATLKKGPDAEPWPMDRSPAEDVFFLDASGLWAISGDGTRRRVFWTDYPPEMRCE